MPFSAVYRAFDDNWEIAARFYRGESVPPTAAAKASGELSAGATAPVRKLRLHA
jgi:hypothetical protein